MFAKYNFDKFPIVYIDISGTINNDSDFSNFTNEWLLLYNNCQDFEFVIDTKNAGIINIKYCIYMAFFIKTIKKKPIQYLKKSKIYIYNYYIFTLFKLIFQIEKPVAPVELILITNKINKIEYIEK